MMTTPEIALLANMVLSRVASRLAARHPPLVSVTYDDPGIAAPNSESVWWHKCSTP
jgi:hypothetical protein